MAAQWDSPRVDKVAVNDHHVKRTHHMPGAHTDLNRTPGNIIGTSAGGAPALDSPVPAARQMPDNSTTAHASEVAAAIADIGDDFPADGVMRR